MTPYKFLVLAAVLCQAAPSTYAFDQSIILGSVAESKKFDAVKELKKTLGAHAKLLASPSEQNAYARTMIFREFRVKRAISRSLKKEADAFCKVVNPNSEIDLSATIPYDTERFTGNKVSVASPAHQTTLESHLLLHRPYYFYETSTRQLTKQARATKVLGTIAGSLAVGALVTGFVLFPPLVPLVPLLLAGGALGMLPTLSIPQRLYDGTLSYKAGKSLPAQDVERREYAFPGFQDRVVPHSVFTRIACAPIKDVTQSENFVTRLIAKARSKFSRSPNQSRQNYAPNLRALRGR